MTVAVVKDNVLYIDSGVEKFNDSGNIYFGISMSLGLRQSTDVHSLNNSRQPYFEYQPDQDVGLEGTKQRARRSIDRSHKEECDEPRHWHSSSQPDTRPSFPRPSQHEPDI